MEITIKLLTYFIIYSFFGWILESVVKTIIQKKIINSGFLHGPVCPIYGIGAIIMLVFLKNFKNNYVALFLTGFLVLSVWEYIVGWALEKIFNTKYWDYSQNKFNIHGRVCLFNSLFWGFLGVIFMNIIHPNIERLIVNIPINVLLYINIPIFIALIVDSIITIIKVTNINIKLDILKEISEELKEKLEELKEVAQKAENRAKNNEKLNVIIEELKEKQVELKERLERQTYRLRKAFPTMKSEKISEFLSEKIEKIKRK